MEEVFHWAMIGAGTLAKQVAKQITASGRHKIVSVYTRNYEKCSRFAEQYGALAVHSAQEAISAPEVEGVYVVTTHPSHYEYTKLALELGKPVLCEKPMTVDAKSTEELIRLSEEKGVYLAEAMWTWFSPVARQVKKWLDQGEYGEIEKVHMTYHLRSISYAPRVSDPNAAGGALLDIAIYPLTYIYRLFGMPEKIECEGALSGGIDTGEEIRLYYPDGKCYTVSTSILDFKGLEKMRLEGSKAKTVLWFYHGANKVTLKRKKGHKLIYKGNSGMLNEFDLVAKEIREGLTESRYVPHSATLAVMKIMDECRRQMGLVYPFEK